MIAHFVAASENRVIGKAGGLPWNIPEDMKWFRERTKHRALIMGRKTFESVGHPLPNRLNVVVTRQKDYQPPYPTNEKSPVVIAETIEDALEHCKRVADKYQNEIMIIGGGEIYRQSMPLVNTIFMTRVHADIQGDTYYPEIDSNQFELVEAREFTGDPSFTIQTFRRK